MSPCVNIEVVVDNIVGFGCFGRGQTPVDHSGQLAKLLWYEVHNISHLFA